MNMFFGKENVQSYIQKNDVENNIVKYLHKYILYFNIIINTIIILRNNNQNNRYN